MATFFCLTALWAQSRSYLTTDGQSTSLSRFQASIWGTRPILLFSSTEIINSCGFLIVRHLLWRKDGCYLLVQLFLGFASAGCSRAEALQNLWQYSAVSHETPPTWMARSPYLYPPDTEWPSYIPGHWVLFSSPLTTRRATVEVCNPSLWALPNGPCYKPSGWTA
jgi:hypothetical protein